MSTAKRSKHADEHPQSPATCGPFLRADIAKTLDVFLKWKRVKAIFDEIGLDKALRFESDVYLRARRSKPPRISIDNFRTICQLINYNFGWTLRYRDFCRSEADVEKFGGGVNNQACLKIRDKDGNLKRLKHLENSKTPPKTLDEILYPERRPATEFRSPERTTAVIQFKSASKGAKKTGASPRVELQKQAELTLTSLCKAVVDEWEAHWTGRSEFGKRQQLLHYVPARFSIELTAEEYYLKCSSSLRNADSGSARKNRHVDQFELVEGKTEEDIFDNMIMNSAGRLCVSDGPGCGKSIFSRRVQAYLCSSRAQDKYFGGQPGLVVRWEESSEIDGRWPEDFMAALDMQLTGKAPNNGRVSTELSNLLKEHRVFLILDSLDQTTARGRKGLDQFLKRLNSSQSRTMGWKCRMICTSRPYADSLIRGKEEFPWRMARIERFEPWQQCAYLYSPVASLASIGGAWLERLSEKSLKASIIASSINAIATRSAIRDSSENARKTLQIALRKLIPAQEDDDPITSIPQSLLLIRQLHLERKINHGRKKIRFESLADLYRQVSLESLARAFRNSVNRKAVPTLDMLLWLEAMLSAMAMQMLVTDPWRFEFTQDDDLPHLMDNARRRVTLKRPPFPGRLRKLSDWNLISALSRLTNRLTGVLLTKNTLAWPDQRMKEYYAARHLLHNDQPNWVADRKPDDAISCGDADLRKYATHPQWSHVWNLALELAEADRANEQPEKFLAAARHLFDEITPESPKVNGNTGNTATQGEHQSRWLRPTHAMYRVYALLQRDIFMLEREQILTAFQQQFTRILTSGTPKRAAIAAQLIPEFALRELIQDESRLELLLPIKQEEAFVRCPPMGDSGIFWMGTDSSYKSTALLLLELEFEGDDYPRHPVRLASFWMQATSVTVEQFELFDPMFTKSRENAQYFENFAPSAKCPVIRTNYFDAAIFALWTGNSLPTEAQREFAARAGRDGVDDLFGVSWNGNFEQITSEVANFDGMSVPLPRGQYVPSRHIFASTTLPVRWTAEERAAFGLEGPNKPLSFVPNAWRIWQMQGNVWEWCRTVFREHAYATRVRELISNYGKVTLEEVEESLSHLPLADIGALYEPDVLSPNARRILRGGGWDDHQFACRAGNRIGEAPDSREYNIGFRLCR